jgi:hypothetical protein
LMTSNEVKINTHECHCILGTGISDLVWRTSHVRDHAGPNRSSAGKSTTGVSSR